MLQLTDAGASHDRPIMASPDGSRLVFFRPDGKGETGDSAPQDAFVIGADGSGLTTLSPPGTTTAFVFFHDTASWSPDGSKVAMALANGPFWTNTSRSVYVGRSDGSDFKRIGPRGDIWDAVWSPDGNWVAFTLATKASTGLHELFLMHPDGSALHALVSASDGLFSLQPVWSPESDQLLFKRGMRTPASWTSGRSTSTGRHRGSPRPVAEAGDEPCGLAGREAAPYAPGGSPAVRRRGG